VEAAFLGAGAGLLAAFATGAIVLAIPTVASVLTNTAILAGTKVLSGASNYYNKDAARSKYTIPMKHGKLRARSMKPQQGFIPTG
jgi:hypothetical protein